MSRGLVVLATVALCLAVFGVYAQQPTPADKAPWHLAKISKLSSTRAASEASSSQNDPLRYLHLRIQFTPAATDRALHKFQVVDRAGKKVGELWGYVQEESLLIFEGEKAWSSLVGLYLDGLGHREPLFVVEATKPAAAPAKAAAPEVMQPARNAVSAQRPGVEIRPASPQVTPAATDVRARVQSPAPDKIVGVTPRPAIVEQGRDQVYPPTVQNVVPGVVHGGVPVSGAAPGVGRTPAGPTTGVVTDAPGPAHSEARVPIASHGHGHVVAGPGAAGPGGGAAGPGLGTRPVVGPGAGKGSGSGPGTSAGGAEGSGRGEKAAGGEGPGPGKGAQSEAQKDDEKDKASGQESDAEKSPGQGPGKGTGQAPGLPGQGPGPGKEPGRGPGEAPGPGPGEAAKPAESPGQGPLPGMGPGPGPGEAPGPGPGPGPGEAPGPGPGPAPAPGEGPGPGPGPGPGGGGGTGPGPTVFGPNYRNLAPQPIVRNHAPHLRFPHLRGPVIDVYNPEIPYYDPRWYYNPNPGYPGGPGYGGGGAGGPGGPGRYAYNGPPPSQIAPPPPDKAPQMVLYLSCGDDSGPGKVYQVDENGRVLGVVNLPFTATGLALHRAHGLVCAIPRDGGKLMRIDDTGKVATLLEKDETLVHPVDVGIPPDSDTVVVADNIADVLAATTAAGGKPKVYQHFQGQKWDQQEMSVAVADDKHVLLGTNGEAGIYRFSGDGSAASLKPLLPGPGGVAADIASLKWAATQNPNAIHVFEGDQEVKRLKLPANKSHYRNGLLSFAPAGRLVAATRPSDNPDGEVWLIQFGTEKDEVRSLFPWNRERLVDFVVGPRMYWERHDPKSYKSVY